MTTASIRKIALVSLLLAPISAAFGHESADLATKPSVAPFNESESAAILQEIKLFANARISARHAIAIAERRGVRAKVIDLSFDGTASRLAYRVKVLLNEQLWEGAIDASTGVPVGRQRLHPGWTRRTGPPSPPSPLPAWIFPRRSQLPNNTAPAKP